MESFHSAAENATVKRNPVPSYLFHKRSGRARAVWTDPAGQRHDRLLPGLYDSEESKKAFALLQLEVAASPIATSNTNGITVNEVMLAFMTWAPTHYRTADGRETSEVAELKWSVKFVRELYGERSAADFGPLALKAVREKMIQTGWCRSLINKRIDRVKRAFKWCVGEELVSPSVYEGLRAVPGLRLGRSEAPESTPVKPVDAATVTATLPYLGRHVRAMVELQQLTGMRPGEVCRMRLSEIDLTASPWTYKPATHKTAHHGKTRTVMIGPRARAILEAFIAGGTVVDPSGPMFSPRRAREERFAEMRANRKSKVTPSQVDRRKAKPKLLPAMEYTPHTYAHAIRSAAKKAGVPHWHPNQLRHSFATMVRRDHGLEPAQVLLGHSKADITQTYAERDEKLAATVAAKIG